MYAFEAALAASETRPAIVWYIAVVPVGIGLAIAAANAVWSKVIVPSLVRLIPIEAGDFPFTGICRCGVSSALLTLRTSESPVNTLPDVELLLVPPLVLELVVIAEDAAIPENTEMSEAVNACAEVVADVASAATLTVTADVEVAATVTSTPASRLEKVLLDEVLGLRSTRACVQRDRSRPGLPRPVWPAARWPVVSGTLVDA